MTLETDNNVKSRVKIRKIRKLPPREILGADFITPKSTNTFNELLFNQNVSTQNRSILSELWGTDSNNNSNFHTKTNAQLPQITIGAPTIKKKQTVTTNSNITNNIYKDNLKRYKENNLLDTFKLNVVIPPNLLKNGKLNNIQHNQLDISDKKGVPLSTFVNGCENIDIENNDSEKLSSTESSDDFESESSEIDNNALIDNNDPKNLNDDRENSIDTQKSNDTDIVMNNNQSITNQQEELDNSKLLVSSFIHQQSESELDQKESNGFIKVDAIEPVQYIPPLDNNNNNTHNVYDDSEDIININNNCAINENELSNPNSESDCSDNDIELGDITDVDKVKIADTTSVPYNSVLKMLEHAVDSNERILCDEDKDDLDSELTTELYEMSSCSSDEEEEIKQAIVVIPKYVNTVEDQHVNEKESIPDEIDNIWSQIEDSEDTEDDLDETWINLEEDNEEDDYAEVYKLLTPKEDKQNPKSKAKCISDNVVLNTEKRENIILTTDPDILHKWKPCQSNHKTLKLLKDRGELHWAENRKADNDFWKVAMGILRKQRLSEKREQPYIIKKRIKSNWYVV